MGKKLLKALFCFLLVPGLVLAQNAVITGSVTDGNGEALTGANVVIDELVIGASTDIEGKYRVEVPGAQVNGQQVTLTARFIGYTPVSTKILLKPGEQSHDFVLRFDEFNLDEVVVTGVSEATPKKKLSFTVANVSEDQLKEAPGRDALSGLAGKIAGVQVVRGGGEPGDGVSIMLRGATSITHGNSPLFIIDGTIMASSQVDFDALDIESIEVVKGAAASSLYGSRAQAGVIQIRTKRGTAVPVGQTRVSIRNEFGFSSLPKDLPLAQNHSLLLNASGDGFLDAAGQPISCTSETGDRPCILQQYLGAGQDKELTAGVAFQDNAFPCASTPEGRCHDHMDQIFDPGESYSNYISVQQNTQRTNFLASFNNLQESGVINAFLDGYNRKNVRVNLDHVVRPNLTMSVSGYYSRSTRDNPESSDAFNPFFAMMFISPLANLMERDDEGQLLIQPDPKQVEENPLYAFENAEIVDRRQRVTGSFRARWTPVTWFDLEASFSYDRSDRHHEEFYDRGYETIDRGGINLGRYSKSNGLSDAINTDITASFRRQVGDFTLRSQARYAIERDDGNSTAATGTDLVAAGVKDLSNFDPAVSNISIGSSSSSVRAIGYFFTVGGDYKGRYIGDVVVRRDGSSLFGPDERWANYYRVSGAYRLSEEPWWPLRDMFNEFKVRYARGTAGGRPNFSDQYETFSVSNGVVSKNTLGNSSLKPEFQTEQEFGIDFVLLDKLSAELVYASSVTEDQLLAIPLAGFFGFGTQWRNAGTLESNTYEVSINATLMRRRNMSWQAGFTYDRTRQEITKFDSNPFITQSAFYIREGEKFGAMYGTKFATQVSDLPDEYEAFADQFDVDSEGYLVAVGAGNTAESGIANDLWGTSVDVDNDGVNDYTWGMPITSEGLEGDLQDDGTRANTTFLKIGDAVPDFSLGLNSTFRIGGFQAYMLWNAQIGGDIYNNTKQWTFRDDRHGDQDQGGVPDAIKKPQDYYQALYNANQVNSHFVEEGTFVKLRELSLSYTFDRSKLSNYFGNLLHEVRIGVIGRNLLTFTDYSGWDPEVGTGNATIFRWDGFRYPNFRTVTGKVEIIF